MFNAFNATGSGANQIHAYMPTGAENGDTDVIQFGDYVISYVSREVSFNLCWFWFRKQIVPFILEGVLVI